MNTEALQDLRVLHILQKISSKHSPLSGCKYISAVYYNIGQVQKKLDRYIPLHLLTTYFQQLFYQ